MSATNLCDRGYTSIEDLRARGLHELNANQRVGLRCFEDFERRIPRWGVSCGFVLWYCIPRRMSCTLTSHSTTVLWWVVVVFDASFLGWAP